MQLKFTTLVSESLVHQFSEKGQRHVHTSLRDSARELHFM